MENLTDVRTTEKIAVGIKKYTNNEENVIRFNFGLPGFESLTKFLIEEITGYTPFKILHSIEEPSVALLIIEYKKILSQDLIELTYNELKRGGAIIAKDDHSTDVYTILQYDREIKSFTANLKAPIIVDTHHMTGNQIILDHDAFPVNYQLNQT